MTLLNDIDKEMQAAIKKFPTWPSSMLDAFAIVQEEIGEAQKDILQLHYEPIKHKTCETIRIECIQSICMLLRFIKSLDNNQYKIYDKRNEQHEQ